MRLCPPEPCRQSCRVTPSMAAIARYAPANPSGLLPRYPLPRRIGRLYKRKLAYAMTVPMKIPATMLIPAWRESANRLAEMKSATGIGKRPAAACHKGGAAAVRRAMNSSTQVLLMRGKSDLKVMLRNRYRRERYRSASKYQRRRDFGL